MLEEAIYKFKVSGPTIMPSLFDNFFLKETEAYNGYAILTYEVHQPLPIDEVLNIMDSDAYMRILYYTHPNPRLSRQNSVSEHVPTSCRKSSVISR